MTNHENKGPATRVERRRTRRRPVLDTFALFVVVPRKGDYKLKVSDISDLGIGFDFDIEGESTSTVPVKIGDGIELRLYLNQSLYLPLTVRCVRVEEHPEGRKLGAEFTDKDSKTYQAFLAFIHMLDGILDVARIEK
ncbi:PilZ domain-containing protein [Bdellovibrionota bacterium FG-2]